MVALTGALAASAVQSTGGHLSADLGRYGVDYWPPHAGLEGDAIGAARAFHSTGTVVRRTVAGSGCHGFDWYGHVHVGENQTAYGRLGPRLVNPVGIGNAWLAQTRHIEVWNAFLAPQTLSGITGTGTDGVTLAPHVPGLPDTFAPLESRLYDVTITPVAGSPALAATYSYAFTAETVRLRLSGRRATVFGFRPDWSAGVLERLEWLTDVMASRGGLEQRVALREIPRRSLEFSILAAGGDHGRLDALLSAWQSRPFVLPIWPDKGRLDGPAPAGAMALATDTAGREYQAGGTAVLLSDADRCESVEIDAVLPGVLSLRTPVAVDWPAGSSIYPARQSRLVPSQTVRWLTGRAAQAALRFDIIDNANMPPVETGLAHRGVPVHVLRHNWSDPLEVNYSRVVETFDFDTGPVAIYDPSGLPSPRRSRRLLGSSRADILAFKAWLHARQGRLVPFYAPTRDELVPASPVGAADVTIDIKPHDEASYVAGLQGHTDIALQRRDGTWLFRQVTHVETNAASTRLTVSSAFGVDLELSDIARLCWLELVRLDADAVEIRWLSDGVAESAIATRGIAQ